MSHNKRQKLAKRQKESQEQVERIHSGPSTFDSGANKFGPPSSVRKRSARGSTERIDKEFTAHEAQHILTSEGGELTVRGLIVEAIWAIAISAALAWAIVVGKATAWHMLIPMVAEYFAYLVALPIVYLFIRHHELKVYSWQSVRALLILILLATAAMVWQSHRENTSLNAQLNSNLAMSVRWILEVQLQWPILLAIAHAIRNLLRNVHFLLRQGPPFLGPGMGCGFRIAIFVLALILVPAFGILIGGVLSEFHLVPKISLKGEGSELGWIALTWIIWACLLVADLTYLWFRWDMQTRLKAKGYQIA